MIIDFHAHLISPRTLGAGWWDSWVKLSSQLSGKGEERIRRRLPEFWDETGELLLGDMDQAGIDATVISVADFALGKGIGEPDYDILEINRLYSLIGRRHPGRLIPFAGVDPRRKNALEVVKIALNDFAMKGLKLLPPCGFYPADRICYPLYELASEKGVPLLIHTGADSQPLYSKFCQPLLVDEVANDFPELKIILAHAGFGWWPEALSLANSKPNLYLDLAGWQPRAKGMVLEELFKPLKIMMANIGSHRVFFGSDWPFLRLFMNQKTWIEIFKNPPEEVRSAGMLPRQDQMEDFLGNGAARLLGLEK